jgi:hypothetical protein
MMLAQLPVIKADSPRNGQGREGLLALLLDEQQLTAVELFDRAHEAGDLPAQAKHYSRLLPAAPPGPGQQ